MEFQDTNKTALHLPNNLHFLPIAIGFVKENARLTGFKEKEIQDIELAVEEAVSNVIEHAFSPGQKATFSIICTPVSVGLKITIRDKGLPFDPKAITVYNPEKAKEDIYQKGLGWHLMKKVMDEVVFENLGREGKEIHLIKHLPQKPLEKAVEHFEMNVPAKQETVFSPKSVPFTVRRAQASDAIEITKCAYEAYGYTYVFEPMYYPERFGQILEQGEVLSAIAMTKNENPEIMAHNSLSFDDSDERVATMGMTFTRRKYQNQGCGKKLGLFLIKEAIKRGILGLTGTAATLHVYSQKGIHSAGVKVCALYLAYHTDKYQWKDFEGTGQRETTVLGYFKVPLTSTLRLRGPKKISVPERHQEIIRKIYKNLDRKFNPHAKSKRLSELPEEPSNLSVYTRNYDGYAKIKVNKIGADIIDQIRSSLNRLSLDKIESINLYLNLASPYAAELSEEIEKTGFFFCGILPGPVNGDRIIFQYLNNIKLDYSKIQLYTEFSKELLTYIKQLDPYQ